MKNFNGWMLAAFAFVLVQGAWAQRPFYLVPGVHPGYSLVSMRPTSTVLANPIAPVTGGMAWLPDGRLFIASMSPNTAGGPTGHLLGASNGYIFSGIPGATSNATVTATQVTGASDYRMPSGVVALGDTLFVLDNLAGLTKLTPSGGGNYVKSPVYGGLISDTGTKNLGTRPANTWGHRTWNGGLVYKDGFFYAAVGQGLISGNGTTDYVDANRYRGKGTILKIPKNGGRADTLAGGVRNAVSLVWGPEGEMFYTDNQGSFMPSSAMFHVKQGRYFGHPKTPFDNQLRTPPAIIFPYGGASTGGTAANPSVAKVATDMLLLRDGRFAGQLLVGANHTTGVNRVFLEKVGGEFQGALFPFSQGFGVGSGSGTAAVAGVLADFRANVNRMSYGPDGQIYVGGGNSPGNSSSGSHGFEGSLQYGLARLVPNNTPVFEMKAIRSLGSTQVEIEFTEPVVSAATTNFTVRQYGYLQGGTSNNEGYGAGHQQTNATLTVSAVTLNTDKTRATVTISTGMLQRPTATTPNSVEDRTWGYVLQINVTGVAAVSNGPMWGDGSGGGVAWYTLNKFGPGVDAGGGVSIAPANRDGSKGLNFSWRGETLVIKAPVNGVYTLRVLDAMGRTSATFNADGKSDFVMPASAFGHGLRWIEAKTLNGQRWISRIAPL